MTGAWIIGLWRSRWPEQLAVSAAVALAIAMLAVLGAFVLGLFAWMLHGMARPDPVQGAWIRFCGKLAAKGVARSPHEGPRDYAERAARRLPAAGEPIRSIADLYIALRYGNQAEAGRVIELRRRVKDLEFG